MTMPAAVRQLDEALARAVRLEVEAAEWKIKYRRAAAEAQDWKIQARFANDTALELMRMVDSLRAQLR